MTKTETLAQCIYASAAQHKMSGEELHAILDTAREFNASHGVSGMLVYHGGSFLQILEGDETQLEDLVEKIKQDPRHHDFKLLLKDRIPERAFGAWSMGFVDSSGFGKAADGFVDYDTDFHKALKSKSTAQKILNQFKEGTWRRYVDKN